MTRTVAITGATGFIGRRILTALLQHGFTVHALTRQLATRQDGVTWVRGSLQDQSSLARLVEGAGAVIHCAGQVRGGSRAVFQRDNVDGTVNLVRAAKAAGCGRFLLFSSLAARHPQLSWYAQSKHDAELAAFQIAAGMPISIFRPTAVYGPGDSEMQPLLSGLLSGWLPRFGHAQAQLSFLHVDDLTRATLCWLAADVVDGACYEISDGTREGYSWQQLAALGAQVREGPVRLVNVPAWLLKRLSQLNVALHRLRGGEPMLTPSKVNELLHPDWSSSNRVISQHLGWHPAIDLECALRERWF